MLNLQTKPNLSFTLPTVIIVVLLTYASYNGVLAYRIFNSLEHEKRGNKLIDECKYVEAEHELDND